jgi:hypothetical protein
MAYSRVGAARSSFGIAPRPSHGHEVLTALTLGILGFLAVAWGRPSRATASDSLPVVLVPSSGEARVFATACEEGDATACNDLGVCYQRGYFVPPDSRSAFRLFDRACSDGSADGCSNLGALYEQGAGTRRNLEAAARLYEQACNDGAALGCSNLGALYARGLFLHRDRPVARRLFSLACESGSATGCSNLLALARRAVKIAR